VLKRSVGDRKLGRGETGEEWIEKNTFIILVPNQILRRNHIQQLQDSTAFKFSGLSAGKHGHSLYAHIKTGGLSKANARASHFDLDVAELHVVQAFDGDGGGGGVDVFGECYALCLLDEGGEGMGGEGEVLTRGSWVPLSRTMTKALRSPNDLRSSMTCSSVK
jgi:hypothetical protein